MLRRLAVVTTIVLACSHAATTTAEPLELAPPDHHIAVSDDVLEPSVLVVPAGTEVVWWFDSALHLGIHGLDDTFDSVLECSVEPACAEDPMHFVYRRRFDIVGDHSYRTIALDGSEPLTGVVRVVDPLDPDSGPAVPAVPADGSEQTPPAEGPAPDQGDLPGPPSSPPASSTPRVDLRPLDPSPAGRDAAIEPRGRRITLAGPIPPSEARPPAPRPPVVRTPGLDDVGAEAPRAERDPEPRSGGFPAHLRALHLSVIRSGPGSTAALLDLASAYGVDESTAVELVFGSFPVGGLARWSHDWWNPRWGPSWRLHEGIDILARHGTPVRAPAAGEVRVSNGGLGGLAVHIVEPDGSRWYLAHLAALADGMGDAVHVGAGDVVGFVGDSGNARGGPPHLHLGYRPGGGPNVDPKPIVDAMLAEALAAAPAILDAHVASLGTRPSDPSDDGPPPATSSSPSGVADIAAVERRPGSPARSAPATRLAAAEPPLSSPLPMGPEMLVISGFVAWAILSRGLHHPEPHSGPRMV